MTDPDAYPPISLFDGKSEATVTSTKQVQA
jgi:hypothetical protein